MSDTEPKLESTVKEQHVRYIVRCSDVYCIQEITGHSEAQVIMKAEKLLWRTIENLPYCPECVTNYYCKNG